MDVQKIIREEAIDLLMKIRGIYKKSRCFNCKKIFYISTREYPSFYNILFCCEKCQDTYCDNELLGVVTKLDVFPHIESRFEILDL